MSFIKLPEALLTRLKDQLGDEFPAFLTAMQQPRMTGVCGNKLKVTADQLQQLAPYLAEAVPWCDHGFYYDECAVRPAKHPYYHAGLYYIQEPSAMLPASLLAVKPGERVLDLCAAPGGKSVQLAGQLQRTGLLVANDISHHRAKVLLKNLERHGAVNAVVANESPQKLATVFAGFFDKILIDAPCSGEGMFRREAAMIQDWTPEEAEKYACWQHDILQVVPVMLRPGGQLVYSTCTFSQAENEDQIAAFCRQFPEFTVLEQRRIWPHKEKGEGHFAAKLAQQTRQEADKAPSLTAGNAKSLDPALVKALGDFSASLWGSSESWQTWLPAYGQVVERAGHVLWEASSLPVLKGCKILRSGWLLGLWEKGRFRPSHAYAMGLPREAVAAVSKLCNFTVATERDCYEAVRYLRGETIGTSQDWPGGYHLVTIDDFPLGWAKGSAQGLKNEYPPGWRWED